MDWSKANFVFSLTNTAGLKRLLVQIQVDGKVRNFCMLEADPVEFDMLRTNMINVMDNMCEATGISAEQFDLVKAKIIAELDRPDESRTVYETFDISSLHEQIKTMMMSDGAKELSATVH